MSLPEWEFVRASEAYNGCQNADDPLLGIRQATYAAPEPTGRSVILEVISRHALCPTDEIPMSLDDLGPTAETAVVEHDRTTVMGHEARIVEEGGVFWVMWLLEVLEDPGSSARIIVFPGSMPLTAGEVLAIAQGVIELTGDEWQALLAATG